MTEVTSYLKASDDWTEPKARKAVRSRSAGLCEARIPCCTGRSSQVHHVLRRSQGGAWNPMNLLAICDACHRFLHANVAEAKDRGLLA